MKPWTLSALSLVPFPVLLRVLPCFQQWPLVSTAAQLWTIFRTLEEAALLTVAYEFLDGIPGKLTRARRLFPFSLFLISCFLFRPPSRAASGECQLPRLLKA